MVNGYELGKLPELVAREGSRSVGSHFLFSAPADVEAVTALAYPASIWG